MVGILITVIAEHSQAQESSAQTHMSHITSDFQIEESHVNTLYNYIQSQVVIHWLEVHICQLVTAVASTIVVS
jgi:hypothetical protein